MIQGTGSLRAKASFAILIATSSRFQPQIVPANRVAVPAGRLLAQKDRCHGTISRALDELGDESTLSLATDQHLAERYARGRRV